MDLKRISLAQMFQIHATYYLKKTKHKSTIKEDFIDNVVKKKLNLVLVYVYKVHFRLCMVCMEGSNPIEC